MRKKAFADLANHLHMYACTRAHKTPTQSTHIHKCAHKSTHANTAPFQKSLQSLYTETLGLRTRMHARTRTRTHARTHTHTHTRARARTHTHTHTHCRDFWTVFINREPWYHEPIPGLSAEPMTTCILVRCVCCCVHTCVHYVYVYVDVGHMKAPR